MDRQDGHWLWKGGCNSKGYPTVRFEGRMELAHRVAWFLTMGQWPGGLELHHTCPVLRCIAPHHHQAVDSWKHNNSHWS